MGSHGNGAGNFPPGIPLPAVPSAAGVREGGGRAGHPLVPHMVPGFNPAVPGPPPAMGWKWGGWMAHGRDVPVGVRVASAVWGCARAWFPPPKLGDGVLVARGGETEARDAAQLPGPPTAEATVTSLFTSLQAGVGGAGPHPLSSGGACCLPELCKSREKVVQEPCKNRARAVQELCKSCARAVEELCKNHAKAVQKPCKSRAGLAGRRCRAPVPQFPQPHPVVPGEGGGEWEERVPCLTAGAASPDAPTSTAAPPSPPTVCVPLPRPRQPRGRPWVRDPHGRGEVEEEKWGRRGGGGASALGVATPDGRRG